MIKQKCLRNWRKKKMVGLFKKKFFVNIDNPSNVYWLNSTCHIWVWFIFVHISKLFKSKV